MKTGDFNEVNKILADYTDEYDEAIRMFDINDSVPICGSCVHYKVCNMRKRLEILDEEASSCYYYVEDMR